MELTLEVDNKNTIIGMKVGSSVMEVSLDEHKVRLGEAEAPVIMQMSEKHNVITIKTHGETDVANEGLKGKDDMKVEVSISGDVVFFWVLLSPRSILSWSLASMFLLHPRT
ncbi:hypothetical protein Droror1_Dr00006157 [Drosera rotundifolia]